MKQFFDAIKSGDVPLVTALLDQDPSLANAQDNGQPAIFMAKYHRQATIAELLESRGAEIDVFSAAMMGRTEKLEELLKGNQSLASLVSRDGWTPLHLAAFFDAEPAARLLLNTGAPVNARSTNPMNNMPLHAAAASRNSAIVKLLLDHGAAPDAQQHGGWTALHAAAQNGDVLMASMLIESGASVNVRAENNQSPLDLALTKGHQDMVEYLELKGARL
jgi:ankyrin repeat protein